MPLDVTSVSDYGDRVDISLRDVIKSKLEGRMRHRTGRSPMWSGLRRLIGEEERAS
jgi:hypothetical protein